MGSIFGISDLPVSTINSAVQIGGGMDVPKPENQYSGSVKLEKAPETDKFVSKQKRLNFSNPVIKMRNGIGKLMSHFSKVRIK